MPSDLNYLQLLYRYRYLRSTHMLPLLGLKSKGRSIDRLGTLYHDFGYIDRPEQQYLVVNAGYKPAVYELTEAGEQVLREHGLANEESPLLHRGRGLGVLFQHELMISDILSSLEIGLTGRPELSFISWQEILKRAPKATQDAKEPFDIPTSVSYAFHGGTQTSNKALSPDALFGISHPDRAPRFYALEADRDSEPVYRSNLEQTSWLRKLLQYLEVMHSQSLSYQGRAARMPRYQEHFHIANLTLLVVTTNEAHMRAIMELLMELTHGKGHQHILFRTMPSLASLETAPPPTPFILDTEWQRAGHPPIFIDR